MRTINILLVCLGLALGLALAVVIVLFAGEVKLLPAVQTIGSIATALSATVAFTVYLSTVKRHRTDDARKASDTYKDEALSVLEKAYATFTQQSDTPPVNDRLLWLSTARMIVRFQKLREKVTELDHTAVIDENEEHIRLKFYTLLGRNSQNFSREYFCPDGNRYDAINIERRSIAVIFGFARWREGMQDPLNSIDDIDLFARRALPIDQLGAREYLEDFNDYWAKIEERRAALDASSLNHNR
jgi:hypothetical protein